MWKFLSRGVRETLERRLNFTRKETAAGQECNPLGAIQNKLIPGIVSARTFDDGTSNPGGQCKNGSCNDKQHSRSHHGERWRDACSVQQCTFFGALGWSSVMVLGWYLCQPVCRRRHNLPPDLDRLKTHGNRTHCYTEYVSLFTLLSRIALAQPLRILPSEVERTPTPVPSEPVVNVLVDDVDGLDEPEEKALYGPLTGEQALNEAADELGKAQKKVLSEIEHRIGVACLELKKHKEAFAHFQKALELDYPPAAFNLGICYELGVGIAQDLKLAAKHYELASQWGHPTAMYNLGVFHIRGWGGVPVDCDKAKELFTAAAELGQTNAQQALAMLTAHQEVTVEDKEAKSSKPTREPSDTDVIFQALDIVKSRSVTPEPAHKTASATQSFYELLGIKNEENFSIRHNQDLRPVPVVW